MSDAYPRVAALKTAEIFRSHLDRAGVRLGFDEVLAPPDRQPLGESLEKGGVRIGNRFCILPMEGWDGTTDGRPTELTRRRWRNFGLSGAKLIWGGEAVAVQPQGRANPNQLVMSPANQPEIASLRQDLVAAHEERFGKGSSADLYVGLQLTHSGRYSRPSVKTRPEPLTAYAHPLLDRRFPDGVHLLTDDDLDALVQDFIRAARLAHDAGYGFVDVKHCHGYLGHELLSARTRAGRYGGSFENRTRLLRDVIDGIRAEVPGLGLAVRLSAFDTVPYRKSESGQGVPEAPPSSYHSAFGMTEDDATGSALDDARELLRFLEARQVRFICITAGSPYYVPHIQRPALFPPADGYLPPEDPLKGVARQIDATAALKREFPGLAFVGSAYSYLQEWLPNVAQYNVREGLTDFVGLGRMVLSYPDLPADVLAGKPLRRKAICRTFSDCTTGPRLGLVSGCFPLDEFYVKHPHAALLKEAKAKAMVAQ